MHVAMCCTLQYVAQRNNSSDFACLPITIVCVVKPNKTCSYVHMASISQTAASEAHVLNMCQLADGFYDTALQSRARHAVWLIMNQRSGVEQEMF